MQPSQKKQMREFVIAYFPQQGGRMLEEQLDNRLRELGKLLDIKDAVRCI